MAGEFPCLPEIRDNPIQRLVQVKHTIGRRGKRRRGFKDIAIGILEYAGYLQGCGFGRWPFDDAFDGDAIG